MNAASKRPRKAAPRANASSKGKGKAKTLCNEHPNTLTSVASQPTAQTVTFQEPTMARGPMPGQASHFPVPQENMIVPSYNYGETSMRRNAMAGPSSTSRVYSHLARNTTHAANDNAYGAGSSNLNQPLAGEVPHASRLSMAHRRYQPYCVPTQANTHAGQFLHNQHQYVPGVQHAQAIPGPNNWNNQQYVPGIPHAQPVPGPTNWNYPNAQYAQLVPEANDCNNPQYVLSGQYTQSVPEQADWSNQQYPVLNADPNVDHSDAPGANLQGNPYFGPMPPYNG